MPDMSDDIVPCVDVMGITTFFGVELDSPRPILDDIIVKIKMMRITILVCPRIHAHAIAVGLLAIRTCLIDVIVVDVHIT
jgi:hypothetical protein